MHARAIANVNLTAVERFFTSPCRTKKPMISNFELEDCISIISCDSVLEYLMRFNIVHSQPLLLIIVAWL